MSRCKALRDDGVEHEPATCVFLSLINLTSGLFMKVRWNAVLTKWITGSEDGTIRVWVCYLLRFFDIVDSIDVISASVYIYLFCVFFLIDVSFQ